MIELQFAYMDGPLDDHVKLRFHLSSLRIKLGF